MEKLSKIRESLNEALTYDRLKEAEELAKEGLYISQQMEQLGQMQYFKGELQLIKGNLPQALIHFDRAIEFNSKDGESYNDKAICLAELGLEEEALIWFNKGIEAQPHYGTLYNNRGWLLNKMARYDEAIESYKEALKFDPNSPVIYSNLAEVQEKIRDFKGALENFQLALKLLHSKDKKAEEWLLACIERLKRSFRAQVNPVRNRSLLDDRN